MKRRYSNEVERAIYQTTPCMMFFCSDVGPSSDPTLKQHSFNVLCLMGRLHIQKYFSFEIKSSLLIYITNLNQNKYKDQINVHPITYLLLWEQNNLKSHNPLVHDVVTTLNQRH